MTNKEIIASKPVSNHPEDWYLTYVLHKNFKGEYVTHIFNEIDRGFYNGHYFDNYEDALKDFEKR